MEKDVLRERDALEEVTIVGGGLAGSEAAWQIAERGVRAVLYEMRPTKNTGAHRTAYLAELVCSNSLGSLLEDRAAGVLKRELELLGSFVLRCAYACALPAGGALAVDREAFAEKVTQALATHPNIHIIREEVTSIPEGTTIIASGPLTSERLSEAIAKMHRRTPLFFFDALAPIVEYDSIDLEKTFRASRYRRGVYEEGDYLNCPLSREEYYTFVEQLAVAERIPLKEFERQIAEGVRAGLHQYFEGCLPIEVLAQRSPDALRFGPMRPVGLRHPQSGTQPFAVVQLRQDNLAGSLYNMVGFQTNLTFKEQARLFRTIPGLEQARFVRFGQMHRNTFIFSPQILQATLQCRERENLFFAGQIIGVEGYVGNIATGLLAGVNAVRYLKGEALLELPRTSVLGGLSYYVTHAAERDFQPMKANFGLLPPLEEHVRGKRERARAFARRALEDLQKYLHRQGFIAHSYS